MARGTLFKHPLWIAEWNRQRSDLCEDAPDASYRPAIAYRLLRDLGVLAPVAIGTTDPRAILRAQVKVEARTRHDEETELLFERRTDEVIDELAEAGLPQMEI